MSDDRIDVPEIPPGEIGFMKYLPYWSKKKGAYVPGSYPSHTGVMIGIWASIVAAFAAPPLVIEDKNQIPAFSPGLLVDRSDRRANRNVRNLQALVLDMDTGRAALEAVWKWLIDRNIEFLSYATHSNGLPGKGDGRARVIIQLTEPIPGHLAKRAMRAAHVMICDDGEGKITADPSCIDPSRLYYLPAVKPGNEHNYFCVHNKGVPLPTEIILDAIKSTSALVTSARSDGDRVAHISTSRAAMPASARTFGKDDLLALAKNKKNSFTPPQRAALKAAADGERMVVVKGEAVPATIRQGASHGGSLQDEDIDTFLTSLAFKLAVHKRHADSDAVEAAFSASWGLMQDEDRAARNTPYNDGDFRAKYETGVRAADEKSVADAKRTGLPTFEEFKAEQGIEDEGDLASAMPGKIYLGQRCFYMVRSNADGDSDLRPRSNFAIIVRQYLVSREADNLKRTEELYEVDIIISHTDGSVKTLRRTLPPSVLMGKKEFNAYLADINPTAWSGDDDQTRYLRGLLFRYVAENNVPQKEMTHRFGLSEGALVTPQGTYRWKGGYQVELDDTAPVYAPSNLFETNPHVRQTVGELSTEVDIEALRSFAQNATRQTAPEVAWVVAGWFAASALRASIKQFPTLQVVGSKGSGKSAIVRAWCVALAGSELSINGMPRYSQAAAMSGNLSFPFIAEEFRQSKHPSVQALCDNVRDNYTGQQMARSSFKTLMLSAPICIVGEQELPRGFGRTDGATLQRMAFACPETSMIDPKKTPEAAARRAAFAVLLGLDMPGSGQWALYPCWAGATYPQDRITKSIAIAREYVDGYVAMLPDMVHGSLDERTKHNMAVICFGAHVWVEWCKFIGADPGPMPTVEQLCKTTIETVVGSLHSDAPDEQSDPLARYVENLSVMLAAATDGNPALGMARWWLREGDLLCLDVPASLRFYEQHSCCVASPKARLRRSRCRLPDTLAAC